MDLWTLKQLAVVFWKNFTIKKRNMFDLLLEVLTALIFPVLLLLLRTVTEISVFGPVIFNPQPITKLPSFLKNPEEWELVYVPSNISVVKEITETVKKNLNISIRVQGFSSETVFEEYVKYDHHSHKVLAALVFDHDFKDSNDPLPLKVKYRLRFFMIQRTIWWPDLSGWKTHLLFPTRAPAGPRNPVEHDGGSPGYVREGFLAVQHALDKAIMLHHAGAVAQELLGGVHVYIQRFPYPAYSEDGLIWIISDFLPLIFILMFSASVLSSIRSVVREKQEGSKEYQLIVGLRNWMIWASHFCTVIFVVVVIIFLICVLLFAKIIKEPVFRYSDSSIVFAFLACYAVASIFFGFMVSTFFGRVSLATPMGSLLYFASFLPFKAIYQNYGGMSLASKLAACLSPNVALALGLSLLLNSEIKEIGVFWANLLEPISLSDNLLLGHIMGMLLFDTFLYGLVTWYVDTVFPRRGDMSQPWNFFLMCSYWYGWPSARRRNEEMRGHGRTQNNYFESEPTSWVTDIQIEHLHKEFGDKVAVKDMCLNVYRGQITVLLGDSGAGKTTVLSVLTGHLAPTRGEAFVKGYSTSRSISHVRKHLGFCPQQNLLFKNLTVSEHLYFYFMLQRRHWKTYAMESDHMLSVYDLQDKRDEVSESLSEGIQRKLCVMIALIGDSKVVILDEPTVGMDPFSKRVTWDLLQRHKTNRTILLTTHDTDEADILGDRTAIVVAGALRCCGSSVFLKQIHGATYHIVMEVEPQCDVGRVSAVVQDHIPGATLGKCSGAELSFILPKEHIHRFEALFNHLKEEKGALGIASFDPSVTTMEEVFLKVSKLAESQVDFQAPSSEGQKAGERPGLKNTTVPPDYTTPVFSRLNEIAAIELNTGFPLYRQQFCSMVIKRALFTWRNWKSILLQILVILSVTAYLLRTQKAHTELPQREMDLSSYSHAIVPYSVSGESYLTLNLIKNLKIFLKAKDQEVLKVKGTVSSYILEDKKHDDTSIIGLSIQEEGNTTVLTVLFNNEAYHAAAAGLAALDNILFMSLSGPGASIRVFNKPQPLPRYESRVVPIDGKQIVLSLAFGTSLVVGSFGLQAVMERTRKAKYIQLMSGVCVLTYWLSALLWDLFYLAVVSCLLLGVFKLCELEVLVEGLHFLDMLLILVLFGWASTPLMYLASFLFSSGTVAWVRLTLFNYFTTVLSMVLQPALQHYGTEIPGLRKVITNNLIVMLPTYNFAMCVSRYFDNYNIKKLCTQNLQNIYVNCNKKFTEISVYSFGDLGIANFLISLAALGLFYLLLLLFLETIFWRLKTFVFRNILSNIYNAFHKSKQAKVSIQVREEYMDDDVENERKTALAQPLKSKNKLLLKEVTKIYFKCPIVKAVRNTSLVVKNSECFGLLGLNGAGKTTTMKMLIGEETISSGVVLTDGINITKHMRKVWSRIGYCPQSDPILNHMTGRELLTMHARLKGVPEPDVFKYTDTFLHSMCLESHADALAQTYRENKRKLNTAIALMGKPAVVFLDEPFAGMDTATRRPLWDTVAWVCESGTAVVITSHSMEECEALCTRLAIMVKGRFQCLGSPRHLKDKFGDMCTLTVKVKVDKDENKLKEFKEFIATAFPGNIINQEYQGVIYYHIPRKEICWGKVFSILEEAKVLFNLEDYSISQITLEQVFLAIAGTDKMKK